MHPETPTRYLPLRDNILVRGDRAQTLRELHPAEAVPEHFAVVPHVAAAVDRHINRVLVHVTDTEDTALMCPCGQKIVPLTRSGVPWRYTDDDKRGLVLAHLIQRHDWTREEPGEQF